MRGFMKIYTKTGDDGTTGLFDGRRVPKSSLRVEAYGTTDELNAVIGLISTYDLPELLQKQIAKIINLIFNLGSDLATPLGSKQSDFIKRIDKQNVELIETFIDDLTGELPELKNFILPGGTRVASLYHLARTVCRRAERCIVRLSETEEINDNVILFINRLSDYLFTAARYYNYKLNVKEIIWKSDL